MSNFQCILDEELGISLRAAEIAAIRSVFGENGSGGGRGSGSSDLVDYQHFCTVCTQIAPDGAAEKATRGTGTRGGGGGVRPPKAPPASDEVAGSASYITEKVIRRYFELQDSGIEVLSVFLEMDEDEIGLVSGSTGVCY